MSFTEMMREAGLSSGDLADLAGLPRSHVAAFKSGGRTLGQKAAGRMAPHLDAHPTELVVENRLAAMKRAAGDGDARGVLNAVTSIVRAVEKTGAGDATEEHLEALVKFAEQYAEGNIDNRELVEVLEDDEDGSVATKSSGGFVPFSDDEDDSDDPYGYAAEGRDRQGRRKPSAKTRTDLFGNAIEDEDDDLEYDDEDEDEEDGYDAEGRDAQGIRRRPMKHVTTGGF